MKISILKNRNFNKIVINSIKQKEKVTEIIITNKEVKVYDDHDDIKKGR